MRHTKLVSENQKEAVCPLQKQNSRAVFVKFVVSIFGVSILAIIVRVAGIATEK